MATHSIVITWGNPYVGREQMGMGVFMNAIQFYTQCKEKNEIENFDIHLTDSGNTSDLQGLMTVTGSLEQLRALVDRDDYIKLLTKAAHVVNNFRVLHSYTGDEIMRRIEIVNAVRNELGIK